MAAENQVLRYDPDTEIAQADTQLRDEGVEIPGFISRPAVAVLPNQIINANRDWLRLSDFVHAGILKASKALREEVDAHKGAKSYTIGNQRFTIVKEERGTGLTHKRAVFLSKYKLITGFITKGTTYAGLINPVAHSLGINKGDVNWEYVFYMMIGPGDTFFSSMLPMDCALCMCYHLMTAKEAQQQVLTAQLVSLKVSETQTMMEFITENRTTLEARIKTIREKLNMPKKESIAAIDALRNSLMAMKF